MLRSVFFMQTLLAMVRDATIAVDGGGRTAMVDARDIAAAVACGRIYALGVSHVTR